MEDQILKQVTKNITKNPFYEQYYIRKYFGDQSVDSYIPIRMMEILPDKSMALGLKDSELLELLLYRVDTTYHNDMNQRELTEVLMKALDYFVEAEERG